MVFTLIYLLIAFFIFLGRKNYEFIAYVGIIILVFFLILSTNKKVNYPDFALWGLSIWGLLHMAGGGVILGDGNILYKYMIYNYLF